jgi:hypothetical protein
MVIIECDRDLLDDTSLEEHAEHFVLQHFEIAIGGTSESGLDLPNTMAMANPTLTPTSTLSLS